MNGYRGRSNPLKSTNYVQMANQAKNDIIIRKTGTASSISKYSFTKKYDHNKTTLYNLQISSNIQLPKTSTNNIISASYNNNKFADKKFRTITSPITNNNSNRYYDNHHYPNYSSNRRIRLNSGISPFLFIF